MKFIIRDDDLNYFSKPEHIIQWYADVFDQQIPVSFSAIPFIKPSCDAWFPRPNPPVADTEYPVSANQELVNYVQGNPYMEILLHGCTHVTEGNVFEYEAVDGLIEKTLRGKSELESAFGKSISVFVAPHDRISNHGILALERARLNLIRGKGSKNVQFRYLYFIGIIKMIFHRLSFPFLSLQHIPAYPRTLHLGRHQEAFSMRVESEKIDLQRALAYAHTHDGNFILVNHLHDFTQEKKQTMSWLIDEAKKYGADFCFASQVFTESTL